MRAQLADRPIMVAAIPVAPGPGEPFADSLDRQHIRPDQSAPRDHRDWVDLKRRRVRGVLRKLKGTSGWEPGLET